MIKVNIRNNVTRKAVIVDEAKTLGEILEENGLATYTDNGYVANTDYAINGETIPNDEYDTPIGDLSRGASEVFVSGVKKSDGN